MDFQEINLDQIKQIEIEILKHIDSFCKEKSITYFMGYGSLLGTIRHSGFIPWDDDIDLLMPREDYEKFRTTFAGGSHYRFVDRNNRHDWPYVFGKVIDTKTEMEEIDYKSGKIGVYVDIFPIDGLPKGSFMRRTHMLKVQLLHYILITVQKNNLAGSSGFRSVIKRLLYPVGKLWGMNNIIKYIDKTIKKYTFNNSDFVASQSTNVYGMREIMPRDWFLYEQTHNFENMAVVIPKSYNEILTKIYGNYMKLPPTEKQISHHHYRIKFIE